MPLTAARVTGFALQTPKPEGTTHGIWPIAKSSASSLRLIACGLGSETSAHRRRWIETRDQMRGDLLSRASLVRTVAVSRKTRRQVCSLTPLVLCVIAYE